MGFQGCCPSEEARARARGAGPTRGRRRTAISQSPRLCWQTSMHHSGSRRCIEQPLGAARPPGRGRRTPRGATRPNPSQIPMFESESDTHGFHGPGRGRRTRRGASRRSGTAASGAGATAGTRAPGGPKTGPARGGAARRRRGGPGGGRGRGTAAGVVTPGVAAGVEMRTGLTRKEGGGRGRAGGGVRGTPRGGGGMRGTGGGRSRRGGTGTGWAWTCSCRSWRRRTSCPASCRTARPAPPSSRSPKPRREKQGGRPGRGVCAASNVRTGQDRATRRSARPAAGDSDSRESLIRVAGLG